MTHQEWSSHFSREGEHHVRKAKHHRAIVKHAEQFLEMHKTAKSDMSGLDELLESFIEEHSAIADEHVSYAEHCAKCAKSLANGSGANTKKAAGMADELIATDISGVTPDAPRGTLVPRFGQREIGKADVPKEFEKFVTVD